MATLNQSTTMEQLRQDQSWILIWMEQQTLLLLQMQSILLDRDLDCNHSQMPITLQLNHNSGSQLTLMPSNRIITEEAIIMFRHPHLISTTITLLSIPSKITSHSQTFNKIKMAETITSYRMEISSSNRIQQHKIHQLDSKYLLFRLCHNRGQISRVYNSSSNSQANSSNSFNHNKSDRQTILLQYNNKILQASRQTSLHRYNSSSKLTPHLRNLMLPHRYSNLMGKVATKSNKWMMVMKHPVNQLTVAMLETNLSSQMAQYLKLMLDLKTIQEQTRCNNKINNLTNHQVSKLRL